MANDQWRAMAQTCRRLSSKTACGTLVKKTFTAKFIDVHEFSAQLLQSHTNVVIYIMQKEHNNIDIYIAISLHIESYCNYSHSRQIRHDASFYSRSSEKDIP